MAEERHLAGDGWSNREMCQKYPVLMAFAGIIMTGVAVLTGLWFCLAWGRSIPGALVSFCLCVLAILCAGWVIAGFISWGTYNPDDDEYRPLPPLG